MSSYSERIESRAKALVESRVATEESLRELLILSCHSSATARAYFADRPQDEVLLAVLVKIAMDEDDHEGDAPMEAAYIIQGYPPSMLRPHATALLRCFPVQDASYNDSLAMTLARTGDPRVPERVAAAHGAGALCDAGFARAMACLRGELPDHGSTDS